MNQPWFWKPIAGWFVLLLIAGFMMYTAQRMNLDVEKKRTFLDIDVVHMVIASSQSSDATILSSKGVQPQVTRDRDNGELKYTLRSIARNAPWVQRIFLLVNGKVKLPDWVPEPRKTIMIDRCGLLPKSMFPTRNSYAVQSVVHLIPGLAERFIYLDDDILLCKSSTVEDFFENGKPKLWASGKVSEVYRRPEAVPLLNEQIPLRFSHVWHVWVPLLKSQLRLLESTYSEWFNFVRTHHLGRYSSIYGEAGSKDAEQDNSQEEEMTAVWWWWLLKSGTGVDCRHQFARDPWRHKQAFYTRKVWDRLIRMCSSTRTSTNEAVMFMNINDDLPIYDQQDYEDGHHLMTQKLEELFPG